MKASVAGVLACLFGLFGAAGSATASSSVWWGITSSAWPSTLTVPGKGEIVVTVQNRGYGTVDAAEHPIVVRDVLPPGVKASAVEGIAGEKKSLNRERGPLACKLVSPHEVECRYEGAYEANGGQYKAGEDKILPPYEGLEVRIAVVVQEGALAGEENSVSVTGGGVAGAASLHQKLKISESEASVPFGIEQSELTAEEEEGVPSTQAGRHPFQLTDVLAFNVPQLAKSIERQQPGAMPKEISVKLPPGLVGNPTAFPQCTERQFDTHEKLGEESFFHDECKADTAVGVASVTFNAPPTINRDTRVVPIFNLPPAAGEPARFAFEVDGARIYLTTAVRTGSDYGVTVSVHDLIELNGLFMVKTTFWGVPGAPMHDAARGWGCLDGEGPCVNVPSNSPPPLLSMPTSCNGPLTVGTQVSSWVEPKPADPVAEPLFMQSSMPGMDGCNHLQFNPQISVTPDEQDAASASGLEVEVRVPQTAAVNAESLAEGTVRDTTVALPAGVTLNPGGAQGLAACSEDLIGYLGGAGPFGALQFSASLPEPVEPGANFCPDEAKVGTVTIQTPLLPNPLKGAVYIASPAPAGEAGENPFNTLLAMYIVARDPVSGTLVKLPGKVIPCQAAGETVEGFACEAAGQLVSTFTNTPQLPFENLILHFFGGGRAPLATPSLCGTYATHATFVSWSAESGEEPHTATGTFRITSGPNGTQCPSSPRPFTPEFTAGTVNNQAGAYSEVRTTMGHADVDQPLGGLSLAMPPGLMGSLAHVKLCGELQAAEGTCGPESLIGHTTVTAGLGSTPAVVKRPGDVYITGPYNGHGACTVGEPGCAPFGLSIANPAEAGPFDLEKGTPCDCIVVRAKVEVDPLTAQLKVVTGALPTMLKGIPLDLQHIMVGIDRPQFTFNPTGCEHESFGGTLASSEGASSAINVPFQAANCAQLAFKPTFKVSTSGKTSRLTGASLNVKLTYPAGSLGTEANVHAVKVDLPKQLPSNLEALKHACAAATFESNPAACDPESAVGTVLVHTQVLPVPLTGPAYFVSYGAAKFPELVFVLQGDGVTVDVHAETFIKNGITSSTIRTVPDVPFESFELNLPQRPKFAALAAPGGLCNVTKVKIVKKKVAKRRHGKVVRNKHGKVIKVTKRIKKTVAASLVMPTAFTAQNGAVIHQDTPIEVTGCPRTKKTAKSRKRPGQGKRKK